MRAAWSRNISDALMRSLKSGVLSPLLARIKEDDTLMLALRGDYINIYYRGGCLLKITEPSSDSDMPYRVDFDVNYCCEYSSPQLNFPKFVSAFEHASGLVGLIPTLKYVMDRFLSGTENNRPEREFQQLVVRENNFSSVSNSTEYFIVDIELAGVLPKAKFDMLAVRWLSHERNQPKKLVPALIEMKYAEGALSGESGLIDHLEDACALVKNATSWDNLCNGIEGHLKQMKELSLLRFNHSNRVPELLVDRERRPELIFLLSNYNPKSRRILDILPGFNSVISKLEGQPFDVRFCQATFAGYGLHHVSMLTPADFESLAQSLFDRSQSRHASHQSCGNETASRTAPRDPPAPMSSARDTRQTR